LENALNSGGEVTLGADISSSTTIEVVDVFYKIGM
jgi:hypothetical protein